MTSYCIGGLLAMRTAVAHPDRIAAVAAFHGPVRTGEPGGLAGLLSALPAEVYLAHAAGDVTPEALEEINQSLEAAGLDFTSEIYPDTIHGFTMADTDAFDPAALQRHWDRLLPLLDRTLTGT